MPSKIPDQADRPLHELLSREMVDLYVGTSNTHWVLHEKLLCYRSRYFRRRFSSASSPKNMAEKINQVHGLPDEDEDAFKLFVGWLYSERVPEPKSEDDLAPLFDVYLMAEKWEIRRLITEVLDAIRRYYYATNSWPSLRRVQYIYSSTGTESPMRQLLVSCVARMLILGEGVPKHWQHALYKNGQMAVDIILCVQKWHFQPERIPDPREESVQDRVGEAEMKGMKMEGGQIEADGEDDDNILDWGNGLTISDASRSQSQAGATNGE